MQLTMARLDRGMGAGLCEAVCMLLIGEFVALWRLPELGEYAGDGNCAYRAIMFGLVESAFDSPTARKYLVEKLQAVKSSLPSWAVEHDDSLNRGCTVDFGADTLLVSISSFSSVQTGFLS